MLTFHRLAVLVLAAGLCSCEDVTVSDMDLQQAMLLPPTAAKMIVARYLGNAWVEAPFVYNPPICGGHVVPMSIRMMDRVDWNSDEGEYSVGHVELLDCDTGMVSVSMSMTDAQASELTAALIALGAPIEP